MTNILLHGGFCSLDSEFEEFAVNAPRPPKEVLAGYLLNQGDCFGRQSGTSTTVMRFEFPEKPKALPMPAQQCIGCEGEKDVLPVVDAAGEKDQPEAMRLGQGGFFCLSGEDNES